MRIDPSEAAAYNHKPVGDARKPNIPNVVFKSVVEAVDRGQVTCGELAIEVYSMDLSQLSLLKYKLQKHLNH